MRVKTRSVAIALWVCFLAALPSTAANIPSARLEGYRCEVVQDSEAPAGTPVSMVLVCQIVEEGTPTGSALRRSGGPGAFSPTLDTLLNPFTILDHARHEASRPRHDAVVPTPTP